MLKPSTSTKLGEIPSVFPFSVWWNPLVPRDFENQILVAGQLAALEILEQVAAAVFLCLFQVRFFGRYRVTIG